MQTCGSFQLGKEIASSGEADVFHATSSIAPAGAVVKVWRTFDEAASFLVLEGLEAQAAAVAAGCGGILPIYEKGLGSDEWPYCASPGWARSVRQMIEATNYVSADHLERIVGGVLGALEELAAHCGRAHGNLSAGNILLSNDNPSARGFHIYLCDLAPPESAGTYRDDLEALGRIIYQMVLRRNERGSQRLNPPLDLTDGWKHLGREAGRWLAVCNHLLMADSLSGALAIRHAREALRRKSPRAPRAAGAETASRRWSTAVLAGLLLLPIGTAAAWKFRTAQVAAQTVPPALFQQWLEPGRLDEDLQERLEKRSAAASKAAMGSIRIKDIDNAFGDWFQLEMNRRLWVSSDVLASLCVGLTRTMRFTARADLAKLPSRAEAAQEEFDRWQAVTAFRTRVVSRRDKLSDAVFDEGCKSFLKSWVDAQLNPDFRHETFDGHVHERTLARFEHTLDGIDKLEAFMKGPGAQGLNLQGAGVSPSEMKSWGDNGAERWIDHVKRLQATPVPTPGPIPAPTPARSGTATPSATPLPLESSPEPFAAQKSEFNAYLIQLQQQISNPGFNREIARQEQQKLLDLQQSGKLTGIENDQRLVAVQGAFQQLFAGAPFKLGRLIQSGWKEEPKPTPGGDYVVYSHRVLGAGQFIKMPFHRIPQNGPAQAFAIAGIEMPLSLAAAVDSDLMRRDALSRTSDDKLGAQVWSAPPGGGIEPAKSWLSQAMRNANEYLKSNPQISREPFYSTVKDVPPQWETPVNELLPTTAAEIAKVLGGRLPTLAEWRLANSLSATDRDPEQPHLPGAQFQREKDRLEQAEKLLPKKSFLETGGVNSKIGPETGSYQETSKANPSPAVTDLWFSTVNRASEQQPQKIHDMIGNIAEIVTLQSPSGLEYRAVGGSSISPGDPNAAISLRKVGRGGWLRNSDVGFRLVVDLDPTEDSLARFIRSVKDVK